MISVIIPAHNAERYLQEALESVAAQQWPEIEIVVADDRSTDNTAAIASAFPNTRVVTLTDTTGPSAARNAAIRAARGTYIAFLDADDCWPAHRLRVLMAALERQGGRGLVMGRTTVVGLEGPKHPAEIGGLPTALLLFGTAVVDRGLFDRVGFIDEALRYGEDSDWFFRVLESDEPLRLLEFPTLLYRIHEGGMTYGVDLGRTTLPPVMLRQARRLRANPGRRPRRLLDFDELHAPDISVVIPAYNAAAFLRRAIDSVLAQSIAPRDVIVVDDGSTDDTASIAASCGVRVITQPNGGVAAARNTGVAAATGQQVAFLDSDDVWLPGKLEAQWQLLRSAPFPEIVFGHMEQVVDATGQVLRTLPGVHASSMLARRSTLDLVGPQPEGLKSGELMDWLLRARELGVQTAMAETLVAQRRERSDSVMGANPENTRAYLQILKASLDRRRK